MNWIRVGKKDRCQICGKHDWCSYCPALALVHCLRVESDRPSTNVMGGWLHKIGEPIRSYAPRRAHRERPVEPAINFESMWKRLQSETDHLHLDGFAMSLGVDTDCLSSLGCVWNGRAWAFPMKDAESKIIGIRLRGLDGSKWAVKGSKQGLFIPDIESQRTVYITEGTTDAAAALTLGLYAIGRPSCLGCEEMTRQFIRNRKISRAIIISDNDTPGLRGAAKLQSMLPVMNCTMTLPTKDMRDFVIAGGSRILIESMQNDLVWSRA